MTDGQKWAVAIQARVMETMSVGSSRTYCPFSDYLLTDFVMDLLCLEQTSMLS